MSLQGKRLLATWSSGKAAIKHYWQVLIPLGLQAHLCLDGIQLYSPFLSNTIHPVLSSFFCLTWWAAGWNRLYKIARKRTKIRKVLKVKAEMVMLQPQSSDRGLDSSLMNYFQSSGRPQISTMPLFPHLLSKSHHTSSNLREFLWNGEAYEKCCEHGCQTIISYFNVPKSDGNKWNPKLIWYHMLRVAFSKSLWKLAFIIFVGSSLSVYRNMCTHQNRPS